MTQQKAKLYAAVSGIKSFMHCKSKKGMRGKDPQQEGERRERERERERGGRGQINIKLLWVTPLWL